ncbi:MAG: phosphatidylglycerophosphatase A [Thermodesulfobacteriota bacterium]
MTWLIMAIATGGYAGYLPGMPGTWGSLVGLGLFILAASLLPAGVLPWLLAGVIAVAVAAAGSAEKILDRRDPSVVVIDEIAGMLVTLAGQPNEPLFWLAGFVLFRLFDITKPFPIRWVDRVVQGGLGIVGDDLVAGLFANLSLGLLALVVGHLFG